MPRGLRGVDGLQTLREGGARSRKESASWNRIASELRQVSRQKADAAWVSEQRFVNGSKKSRKYTHARCEGDNIDLSFYDRSGEIFVHRSSLSKGNIALLAVSTTLLVLSLTAFFTGSFAWFANNSTAEVSGMHFTVESESISISSVTLYKFDYPIVNDEIDYLAPQNGEVNTYSYYDTPERRAFGEVVHNDQTGEDEWVPVSTMNLYDPLNGYITQRGLWGLNSNAIFKIVIHAEEGQGQATINFHASVISGLPKQENDIWLSDCVDFDLYLPGDLEGEFPADYYPTYYLDEAPSEEPDLTYYKISYLSKMEQSHSHFYTQSEKETAISLGTENLTFVDGSATVYVNVNYAPSQLSRFENIITPEERIRAVYDYSLMLSPS